MIIVVLVDMYRSCNDVLGLCARDNRSNAVDTSGVETSIGIRSGISVGNRSGSSNWGGSSNRSSSIGVGDWSSWLDLLSLAHKPKASMQDLYISTKTTIIMNEKKKL